MALRRTIGLWLLPILAISTMGGSCPTDFWDDDATESPTETIGHCAELCAAMAICGQIDGLPPLNDAAACEAECAGTDAERTAELECMELALADGQCDAEALRDCLVEGEDAEHPAPDQPLFIDEPQAGFFELAYLGCNEQECPQGGYVGEDVYDVIPAAIAYMNTHYPGATQYIGVVPAGDDPYDFLLDPPSVAFWIDGQQATVDPEGEFILEGFAVESEGCGVTDIVFNDIARPSKTCTDNCDGCASAASCDGKSTGDTCGGGNVCVEKKSCSASESCCTCSPVEGMCAVIATAHSLVQIGVVKTSWDDIIDGGSWHPDFLKKINAATGDDDGNRGKTGSQITTGHTANWNKKYKVEVNQDNLQWPNVIEDVDNDCDDLKEWCEKLVKFNEDWNDDCILRLSGPTGGHAVKITKAAWNAQTCRCEVNAIDTGQQDANNDYRNVTLTPGEHTWEFGQGNRALCTRGNDLNFWNQRYSKAWFACYDEEEVTAYPWQSKPANAPGSALD